MTPGELLYWYACQTKYKIMHNSAHHIVYDRELGTTCSRLFDYYVEAIEWCHSRHTEEDYTI